MNSPHPIPCRLQMAAGRYERCPGERCPFWSDGECVVAGLNADLECNPDLAHLRLELRARIGGGSSDVWRPFGMIAPPDGAVPTEEVHDVLDHRSRT